jgi:hypothetical protein
MMPFDLRHTLLESRKEISQNLVISGPRARIGQGLQFVYYSINHYILLGLSGGSRKGVQMEVNFGITKNSSVEVLRSWKSKEEP